MNKTDQEFAQLLDPRGGFDVYNAGLPRFPRNFTRDGIISALLADDAEMMVAQLLYCVSHQGKREDPVTGEEPGKVHHETPGYPIRDKVTTYNGCDTTAFFLIGFGWLQQKGAYSDLISSCRAAIEGAAAYIERHLNRQSLFEEDPRYCGADRFALKVTYWKDSVIIDRDNGEPAYPAVYTLAHLQALCGMRYASLLLNSGHYRDIAVRMAKAIPLLFDQNLGTFYVAIDQQGEIAAISSDALHGLFYLEPGDLDVTRIRAIERASEQLESQIGYMLMTPEDGHRMGRSYHAHTVWPFEQGLIHAGAKKFGLDRVMRVCERVTRMINADAAELYGIEIKEPEISSNPQLWTLAARRYFNSGS